jgi:hypothetical protein
VSALGCTLPTGGLTSARLLRHLRELSCLLANRSPSARKHHLGSAQHHGCIVHVTSHQLPGTGDVAQAMIEIPLDINWIGHPDSSTDATAAN